MITTYRAYRRIMRDRALDRAGRARLAKARLRQLLIHAYFRVPLHRRQMAEAGYDPRVDFRGPEDLTALPVVGRERLAGLPLDEVLEVGARDRLGGLVAEATAGTTGAPLEVYRSRAERAVQTAKWLRLLAENGGRPRDKVMAFAAAARLDPGLPLLRRLGLFRQRSVGAAWAPEEAAEAFLAYQPTVLIGVRSNLVALAEELILRGLRPKHLALVVGGGEVIRETDREICRLAFGVPLIEYYGSIELGATAYQRPGARGLVIVDDLIHLEFLDEAGRPARPGTPARVIATDLSSRTMPFIRYDIGDRVVFGEIDAPDGQPVRVIERVIGRDTDYAPLSGGVPLSHRDVYEVMDHFMGIHWFRLHQRGPDRFDVLLAADRDYVRRIERELSIRLGLLTQGRARFDVVAVDRLPPSQGGKSPILVAEPAGAGTPLQAAE